MKNSFAMKKNATIRKNKNFKMTKNSIYTHKAEAGAQRLIQN